MDPWPFEDEDWEEVERLNWRAFEAVRAEDDIVRESIRQEMLDKLRELEDKYGEHPVLLETRADNTRDAREQLRLYRRALELAVEHGHDTLTIRIWLAELLLDGFGEADQARQVLKDGEDEFLDPDQEPEWASKFAEVWWRCRPQELSDD